ncbi:uncharacterized protein LOC123226418 [Mangifera indica]|uniref:uncharacterized protein LOC123226418 n=1 Tax=Mangifera indica TaxID=29780 RepID=UPI001CF98FD8|nr:uncharacterized protein LOC123226418 [Mangifera indica]
MKKMNVTEKTMLPVQKKKKNRFLITINILGSTGPIRFVVNEDDLVAAVIETALKTYAREGRLPALGLDVNNFSLYPANEGSLALGPRETMGSAEGARSFVLCKNQTHPQMTEARSQLIKKKGDRWKTWFNKSLSFKI